MSDTERTFLSAEPGVTRFLEQSPDAGRNIVEIVNQTEEGAYPEPEMVDPGTNPADRSTEDDEEDKQAVIIDGVEYVAVEPSEELETIG